MNSKIEIESIFGKGSTFSFKLDLKICEPPSQINEVKKELSSEIKNLKILVAEDTEINQLLILQIFKKLSLKIDLVVDGLEALNKAKENKYDIIFLDIFMPELDGMETLSEIRKDSLNKTVPIIALTADVIDNAKERYLAYGFVDYLSKPFKIEDLKTILGKWCRVN